MLTKARIENKRWRVEKRWRGYYLNENG